MNGWMVEIDKRGNFKEILARDPSITLLWRISVPQVTNLIKTADDWWGIACVQTLLSTEVCTQAQANGALIFRTFLVGLGHRLRSAACLFHNFDDYWSWPVRKGHFAAKRDRILYYSEKAEYFSWKKKALRRWCNKCIWQHSRGRLNWLKYAIFLHHFAKFTLPRGATLGALVNISKESFWNLFYLQAFIKYFRSNDTWNKWNEENYAKDFLNQNKLLFKVCFPSTRGFYFLAIWEIIFYKQFLIKNTYAPGFI